MEYNEELKRFETSFRVDIYDYNFTTFITNLTPHMNYSIGAASSFPSLPFNSDITGNTDVFKTVILNQNSLIGTCVLTPGTHDGYDETIRFLGAYKIYNLPVNYDYLSYGLRYTDILTGKYADIRPTVSQLYDENGQGIDTISAGILPYGYTYGGSSTSAYATFYFPLCTVSDGSMTDLWCYSIEQRASQNNHVYSDYAVHPSNRTISWFMSLGGVTPEPTEPTDPYEINGNTEAAGGDGIGYDNLPNDNIPFPVLPTISATNAGFISIWTPTEKQVQDLAKYLWTTDITKSAFWKNLVSNPLELIFGLMIMPVPIDRSEIEPAIVTLGWINTDIPMDYISEQYIDVDFGYIDVEECWGAFLDYEPYTRAEIYLPYIGAKEINVNEIMNKRVSLTYRIDLSSGGCLAIIKVTEVGGSFDSVLYQFSGNCASQIPVSAVQMQEIARATLTVAVGVGATVAAGAVGAGATAGTAAATKASAAAAMTGARAAADGFNSAMSSVQYAHTGSLSAAAGVMGVQDAYLIFSRPEQAIPKDQPKYTGYPSFITSKLSDLTGYTELESIHLEGISCTKTEYDEIESLLYSGVIL